MKKSVSSSEWHVEKVRDKALLREFLESDRLYAAYALGDLEPALFAHCRWFVATASGECGESRPSRTLGLYFTGLQPHPFFTMGAAEGLAAILTSAWRPPEPYFLIPPDHLATVAKFYHPLKITEMVRMVIRPYALERLQSSWRPSQKQNDDSSLVRLGPEHLIPLQQLYAWGNVDGFSSYQLSDGVFYGIMRGEELLSAAGTHIVAPHYGIAAVGNVFTHPVHRGKGYATIGVGAVTADLLALEMDVVLNVETTNTGAINLYKRLGYQEYCHFLEVPARRKESL